MKGGEIIQQIVQQIVQPTLYVGDLGMVSTTKQDPVSMARHDS